MNYKGNILVVDDTASVLELLVELLKEEGYSTMQADNGEMALDFIKINKPDLILLDLKMPGIDGFEVCRRLKADRNFIDIPVIFLSASTEINYCIEGLQLGAVDYITKPFHKEELLIRVKTHLELFKLTKLLKEKNEQYAILNEKYASTNEELFESNQKLQKSIEELRDAKEKIEESEKKYRLLHENSGIGIAYYKPDGTIISFNRIAAKHMNGVPEDFTGKSIYDIFPEQDAKFYHDRILKATLSDIPAVYEDITPLASGNKYFISTFSKILDLNNNISGIQIISQDITERIKAEEALRESEATLNQILDVMPIGLWILDKQGRIVGGNEAAIKIWAGARYVGLDKLAEYKGWWLDTGKPITANDWAASRAIRNGEISIDEEIEIECFDGMHKTILNSAIPLLNEQNAITGAIIINQDITDRKREKELLQNSEKNFKTLFNSGNDAIFVHHMDEFGFPGNFVNVNNSACYRYGYSKEEFLKISPFQLDDQNAFEKNAIPAIKKLLEEGNTTFETIHLTKKGNPIPVEINSEIFTLDGKKVVMSIVRDITERKQAEQALKESEEKYHNLYRNAALGIFHSTFEGKFIDVNPALVKMFGYNSSEELLNLVTSISDQIYAEPPKRDAVNTRAMEAGGFVRTENLYRRKDGSLWHGMLHMRIVPEQDSKPSYFEGFIEDITERKQAEQALAYERQRLSSILEGTNVGTWEWNIQTGETIFNERWAGIIGYSLNEISPVNIETWVKYTHQDDLKLSDELLEKHFKGELDYYECEARMKHKNGEWIWILDRGRVHQWDEEGKPILMSGTHQNINNRKNAEEALRESERRHRTILQTAMDGFWLIDLQGHVLEVNETYCRMSGYKEQELLEMCISDLEVNEAEIDTAAHMQKIIKQKEDRFESKHRRKDGSLFDVEISVQYNPNDGGRLVAFLHDITERKLANKALHESEENYKNLVQHSPDIIYKFSNTKGGLFWSERVKEILGYSPEEFINNPHLWNNSIHPEYQKSVQKAIKEYLNGATYDIEYCIKTKDGKWIWLHDYFMHKTKKGNELIIEGLATDITERKKLEDELRILSRAIDQSPVSIVITDTNGNIEYVNPKFSMVTGYSFEEAIGKNPNILKSGYTSVEDYLNLWKTIKSGKEWGGEFCNMKKNGELYWESAIISPILNENGIITHFVGVKEDITEDKETEQIIQSSIAETEERERMHFSQELHDGLGPLLSTIKLYFQWLFETDDCNKKKIIFEKGDMNLNEAIETIREISNNLSPRTLKSFGAIAALKSFIDNLNQTKKLNIEFFSNTENRFDKKLEIALYRIITELINNTLKHANASKLGVRLLLDEDKKIINLTYRDNGKGFDIPQVQSSGKGFGLYNITQRVDTLNGKINISSSEEFGILVSIELPVNKN